MRIDETSTIRWLTRGAVALLLLAVLAYPLDWLIWEIRTAAGSGMGTATIDSVTTASLKGNRQAFYTDAAIEVPCSRSLVQND